MAKSPKLKRATRPQLLDSKTEWQVRWVLLGRPTLVWLLGLLLIVPALVEVLFYLKLPWDGWLWAVAYLFATASLLLILRRCKLYFPTISRTAGCWLAVYTLFGVALTLGAWRVLLHPPILVQMVDEIADWRGIQYVQVQQPSLYYDQTKTHVQGKVYKHTYSAEMRFRVPMDLNGWVYLDVQYDDDWDQTDNAQLHEQNQLAFTTASRQRFASTDFAYAQFYKVEAAPPERGGYRNHAYLRPYFFSFAEHRQTKIGIAALAFFVLVLGWYCMVRLVSFDARCYIKAQQSNAKHQ